MRYGLLWEDGGAFPNNPEVAVVLDDEVVEVVAEEPEPCPECPEGQACEPLCDHVQFAVAGTMDTEPACSDWYRVKNGEASVDFDVHEEVPAVTEITLYILPQMQKCGHRTRVVYTPGTLAAFDLPLQVERPPGFADYDGIALAWLGPVSAGAGTVQMQIEALPVGSEDWSDFGPLINVTS